MSNQVSESSGGKSDVQRFLSLSLLCDRFAAIHEEKALKLGTVGEFCAAEQWRYEAAKATQRAWVAAGRAFFGDGRRFLGPARVSPKGVAHV